MKDFHFKVIVVGPAAVGKTAICNRFVNGSFGKSSLSTIGISILTTRFPINDNRVTLVIYDIAGQQSYGVFRKNFYRDLNGLIIMIDLIDPSTVELAHSYLEQEIMPCAKDEPLACVAVVGNKADLLDEIQVTDAQLSDLTSRVQKSLGKRTIQFKTSAKNNTNIDAMFKSIAECIITADR